MAADNHEILPRSTAPTSTTTPSPTVITNDAELLEAWNETATANRSSDANKPSGNSFLISVDSSDGSVGPPNRFDAPALQSSGLVWGLAGAFLGVAATVAMVYAQRKWRETRNQHSIADPADSICNELMCDPTSPNDLYHFHAGMCSPSAPTYDGHATAPTFFGEQIDSMSSAWGSEYSTMQVNHEVITDLHILAAKLPLFSITQHQQIGRGSFGQVFRGTLGDRTVAIKRLAPEFRKKPQCIQVFMREAKLMVGLEHPNVVEFIGVAWDSLINLCIVYEFMSSGDLRSLLQTFARDGKVAQGFDKTKVSIAFDVANGLTYLHSLSPKVVHRDLKSRNVLLDGSLRAKLTDFGVSREENQQTMTAQIGTHLWMAPEVMLGDRYDEKADIFSFGVVLSELDTHELPYTRVLSSDASNGTVLLQRIVAGQISPCFTASGSSSGISVGKMDRVVEMAHKCLSLDPSQRPSAAQVAFELHQVLRRDAWV